MSASRLPNGLMLEWVQWGNDVLKYVVNKSLQISMKTIPCM